MHRRRMETEAKAKVVASVWGAKWIQFSVADPERFDADPDQDPDPTF